MQGLVEKKGRGCKPSHGRGPYVHVDPLGGARGLFVHVYPRGIAGKATGGALAPQIKVISFILIVIGKQRLTTLCPSGLRGWT